MHTLQLSPELHSVVNMLKKQDSSKKGNSVLFDSSAYSLSKTESEAVLKVFSGTVKSPKEPNCQWD
jgi:hypothetical protein